MIERLKRLSSSGIDFNVAGAARLAREVFPAFREGFSNLQRKGYIKFNRYFEGIDSEVYYSMVRHLRPRRIVEAGSGYSTIVARLAIDDGGLATRLTAIDPEPRMDVKGVAHEFMGEKVERLGSDWFLSLTAGDILFVDSSHIVLPGNDVTFIFTEILPRISPGVVVHFHDIFLPFDYPVRFVMNEQYLLHAFLTGNPGFEVLWPGCLMRHEQEGLLTEVFGLDVKDVLPGSFWIRRRA